MPIDPTLDIKVTRAFPRARIAIEIHGTLSQPKLELTSDPPVYDDAELLGIIATGDPGNQHVSAASGDQLIVGALSGVVVGRLLDQLATGLPVDVLRVDTTHGQKRLEVGRYLTERIFVTYSHRFSVATSGMHRQNTSEVSAEYRIRPNLMASVRYGDGGIGGITVSWVWTARRRRP
jgi:autotransporter translocation and assembly factor TamB